MGRSGVIESIRSHGNREGASTDLPTLILIHGSMDRQAAFARMSRLLAQSFHVVTYDRRGYGKSSHQRGPFSVEEQINDLTDVIQQTTQGEPLILIGHSFGGVV